VTGDDGVTRCSWGDSPEIYRGYHDSEWGFPVRDDRRLFEKLCLEGFQAGLSWLTILNKREAFRAGFATNCAPRPRSPGKKRRAGSSGIDHPYCGKTPQSTLMHCPVTASASVSE